MSLLILKLELVTSRSLLSKLVVDGNGWIQLYNSATAMVFGYSKFYIEDNGVKRLKDLLTEDFESEFKKLPEDSYFKKNKNKVIGPLRVVNGRNEKDIQTKISLSILGKFKEAKNEMFEKIYLVECWVPDVYTQLQIAGPKLPTRSAKMIEMEEEQNMVGNFHLSKRVFTLGRRKEQDFVEFSNMKFFLSMHTYYSTKDVSKMHKDYGQDVITKYLQPNGMIGDRPFRLATEEEEDVGPGLKHKSSEEEKVKEEQPIEDVKDKQSTIQEWSLESRVNSNDLHSKILSTKPDRSFQFLRYLFLGRLLLSRLFDSDCWDLDRLLRVKPIQLQHQQESSLVYQISLWNHHGVAKSFFYY